MSFGTFGEHLRAARLRFGALDEFWVRVTDAGDNQFRVDVARKGSAANLPVGQGRRYGGEEHRIWYEGNSAETIREMLRPIVAIAERRMRANYASVVVNDNGEVIGGAA